MHVSLKLLTFCIILFSTAFHVLSAADQGSTVINKMCPVLTDEEVDPELSVSYNGQNIGLCCKKCVRLFRENPEKYKNDIISIDTDPVTTEKTLENNVNANAQTSHAHEQHLTPSEAASPSDTQKKYTESPHADNHEHGTSFFAEIGKFHVIIIHFPIALLIIAATCVLANLYVGHQALTSTALILTHIGALSALASTLLGWSTWLEARYPGAENILFYHQWLGTSTCVFAIAASIAAGTSLTTPRHKRSWITILCLAAVLVGLTGHFGGTLIYG